VGVAREIGKYGFRSGEGALGKDHPLDLAQRCEEIGKGERVLQTGQVVEEVQAPRLMRGGELFQEQAPEQATALRVELSTRL
jgi:hypothetical protein